MKKRLTFIVLATLCLNFSSIAQFYPPSAKTIRIGESLPDAFYQNIHQGIDGKTGMPKTIRLKDDKNKLIILDFWATWCKSCIASLIKLDSLSSLPGFEDIVIIPVTYQSDDTARPRLEKLGIDFTAIYGDTLLGKMFPTQGLPHQVWIKDNTVVAIPLNSYATPEIIIATAKGKQPKMLMKNDLLKSDRAMVDASKRIFDTPFGVTGHRANHAIQGLSIEYHNDSTVAFAVNQSLAKLAYSAWEKEIFPAFGPKNKCQPPIRWQVSEDFRKQMLSPPPLSKDGNLEQDFKRVQWLKETTFCYERRIAGHLTKDEVLGMVKQDLQNFFSKHWNLQFTLAHTTPQKYVSINLTGSRTAAIHALRAAGSPKKIDKDAGTKHYTNSFYREVPNWLEKAALLSIKDVDIHQIVDGTGIDPEMKIDMDLPQNIDEGNLMTIRKALAVYGLTIMVNKLPLPFLQITESTLQPK